MHKDWMHKTASQSASGPIDLDTGPIPGGLTVFLRASDAGGLELWHIHLAPQPPTRGGTAVTLPIIQNGVESNPVTIAVN